jgi:pyruvate,water dikinase
MLILGDPDKAYRFSFYPNKGIGLMRLEFIITSSIRIHPMALVKYDELKDETVKKEIDEITAGYDTRGHFFRGQTRSSGGYHWSRVLSERRHSTHERFQE